MICLSDASVCYIPFCLRFLQAWLIFFPNYFLFHFTHCNVPKHQTESAMTYIRISLFEIIILSHHTITCRQ
jgi:hypothetical protein